MDARSTPELVFPAHLPNEFSQLGTNIGAPWSTARLPTPVGPKSCSMPTQDRIRPNHARQVEQAWPEPCHPDQERSINPSQPRAMRRTPQGDIELMPQIQVLVQAGAAT